MSADKEKCDVCSGSGRLVTAAHPLGSMPCPECDGGRLSAEQRERHRAECKRRRDAR